MSENIGWLFYRDYYERALSVKDAPDADAKQKAYFDNNDPRKPKGRNDKLKAAGLPDASVLSLLNLPGHNQSFSLKTTYPGLLIGTGYTHETGMKGEFKTGFFFDHTTGLPVLPGSSVKGILRSVFPGKVSFSPFSSKLHQKVLTFKHEKTTRSVTKIRTWQRQAKLIRILLSNASLSDPDAIDLNELEAEIFDGVRNGQAVSLPQRDIFGDAYPLATDNKLLGTDFITPHGEDLTKNPTPIQMLRVLPGVTFTFQFRLTKGLIDADAKCKLFRQILLHLGAGAKTNVGYGRFEDTRTVADAQETYYKPSDGLSLLPLLPPKPRDNPPPRPAATRPQQPVNFSDSMPPTKPNFFADMDAAKYKEVEGRYYYTGNVAPGVLLEAVPRKDPNSPKQKHFKLLVSAPGQEYEVSLSYSDDSIVGKPCVVKVTIVDKKSKRVQNIEFKAML